MRVQQEQQQQNTGDDKIVTYGPLRSLLLIFLFPSIGSLVYFFLFYLHYFDK